MQDGTRPFYGFPHMNFDEVIPTGPVGLEYHHERMGFKWRVMSRSITQVAKTKLSDKDGSSFNVNNNSRDKPPEKKSEVAIIIAAHHDQIKKNQVFMKAL